MSSRFGHYASRMGGFALRRHLAIGGGESVTIHDPSAGDLAIAAVVAGAIDSQEQEGPRGRLLMRRRELIVPTTTEAADSGTCWTAPRTDAAVTVDGERWAVERLSDAAEGFVRVHLVDHAAAERSRTSYRGRMP